MKTWKQYRLADDAETYGDNAGKIIITDTSGDDEICGPIHDEKNAPLIASAPDLLEALELALKMIQTWGYTTQEAKIIKKAIAMAKGGK